MPDRPAATILTYSLRELVWGIESAVAVISNLSHQIDEHVEALNALRTEAAERLRRLDELRASADHPALEAYLSTAAEATLPMVDEDFPPRLYGA